MASYGILICPWVTQVISLFCVISKEEGKLFDAEKRKIKIKKKLNRVKIYTALFFHYGKIINKIDKKKMVDL